MGRMGRSGPRIIALIAIGSVVAAIYWVTGAGRPGAPKPPDPGVVYVNPNFQSK